jgi:hypothetical protein
VYGVWRSSGQIRTGQMISRSLTFDRGGAVTERLELSAGATPAISRTRSGTFRVDTSGDVVVKFEQTFEAPVERLNFVDDDTLIEPSWGVISVLRCHR